MMSHRWIRSLYAFLPSLFAQFSSSLMRHTVDHHQGPHLDSLGSASAYYTRYRYFRIVLSRKASLRDSNKDMDSELEQRSHRDKRGKDTHASKQFSFEVHHHGVLNAKMVFSIGQSAV